MLLRMKNDLNVNKLVRVCKLYSWIKVKFRTQAGSQVFWQEIEDFLLINSSKFSQDSLEDLKELIVAMSHVGRSNETFWKVFYKLV